ncbi:histonelysine Nmethyltransferase SETMARlike [Trichonephila clavipes]|nr:histonelysine Nmethyltransferase SETMARlike [Trichonephila clavipes]
MTKIHEVRFELLDNPPYSPDLAPRDFFLLPHLKIVLAIFVKLRGNHLREQLFCRENAEYYLDGKQRWEHRWEKCVELQEDYVEK